MKRGMNELFHEIARVLGDGRETDVQAITVKFTKRDYEHGPVGNYETFSSVEQTTLTVRKCLTAPIGG